MSFATSLIIFSIIIGLPLFLYIRNDIKKEQKAMLAKQLHEEKLRLHDAKAAELCNKMLAKEQIREMKSLNNARKHGFKDFSDLEFDRFVAKLS